MSELQQGEVDCQRACQPPAATACCCLLLANTALPSCGHTSPCCRFHVQRFYAVLEPEGMAQHEAVPGANNADIPFSQNVAVGKLPFTSAAAHYRNIEAGVLRVTSL